MTGKQIHKGQNKKHKKEVPEENKLYILKKKKFKKNVAAVIHDNVKKMTMSHFCLHPLAFFSIFYKERKKNLCKSVSSSEWRHQIVFKKQ